MSGIQSSAAKQAVSEADAVLADVRAGYARYFDAFTRGDIEGVLAVLAPDFTWKLPDGTSLDLGQATSAIAEQMTSIVRVYEMSASVENLALQGGLASVDVTERLVATARSDHERIDYLTCEEAYSDVWAFIDGSWRLQTAELVTSVSTTEPAYEVRVR